MMLKPKRAWWELPVDMLVYCMLACMLTVHGVYACIELSSATVAVLFVLLLNCTVPIYLGGITWERSRRRRSVMEGNE